MRLGVSFWLTLASRGLTLAAALLNSMLLARVLGPAGQGSYSVVINAATLLAIPAGLGLVHANTYLTGRAPERAGRLFLQTLLAALAVAPACALVAWRRPDLAAPLFGPTDRPEQIWIAVPVLVLIQNVGGIFLGQQRLLAYNAVGCLTTVGVLAANLAAFRLGGLTLATALRVWIAWLALTLAAVLVLFLRSQRPARPEPGLLRVSLRMGGVVLLCAFFSFVMYRANLFLVNAHLGPAAAGVWAVANMLAELVQHAPGVLGIVIFSRASASALGPADLLRSLRLHILFSGLLALALFLPAPLLVRLLFGGRYAEAATPLRILLVGSYLLGVWVVTQNYVAGRIGFGRPILGLNFTGMAVTLVLSRLLIPRFGLPGAAAALAAAQGVAAVGSFWILRRSLAMSFSWRDCVPRRDEAEEVLRGSLTALGRAPAAVDSPGAFQ